MYSSMTIGAQLAEGKWNDWVADIKNPYVRSQTALLLENQDNYNKAFLREVTRSQRLDENTLISNPGLASLEMQTFPVVRGMLPNLIANELVNVQTMLSPYAPLYYAVAKFGKTKGGVTKGQNLFENFSTDYTGELVEGEGLGTGDGADTTPTLTNLTYTPARPGTVLVTDGVTELRDNGRTGFYRADTGASVTGSIDYASGAFTNLTFPTAPANGAAITATYEYNSEGSDLIPDIDFSIVSTPVMARARKVRFRYSKEAYVNVDRQFSIDLDAELTQQATQLLRWEVDREVLRNLRRAAAAGTVEFKVNPQNGVSLAEHNAGFLVTLTTAKNLIFKATQYGTANWLVMSPEVANIVESLPGFVPSGLIGGRGPVKSGVLQGQWVCYKDPDPAFANQFLVGFKGENFIDTAYILGMYLAQFATETVTLDDFLSRKGLGSLIAHKVVNPKFICKGILKYN